LGDKQASACSITLKRDTPKTDKQALACKEQPKGCLSNLGQEEQASAC